MLDQLRRELELANGDGLSFDDLLTLRRGSVQPLPFGQEEIVEVAFQYFRKTGFPYKKLPIHTCMQEINDLASCDARELLRTTRGYGVADTYHPHRWHATAGGMRSPFQTYSRDDWFRGCLRRTLEMDGRIKPDFVDGLRYYNGTHACSNFRPGFALLCYRKYGVKGGTVLDSSTGYGGRLVGFFASVMSHYIGIDPSTKTHQGNLRMASELGRSESVELVNLPAEDVPLDTVASRCDLAFTSPPYFSKEHYCDEKTQSWKRYPTGDLWRDRFLYPTLRLHYAAIKPGCLSVVNIADVTVDGSVYPLAHWTVEAAKAAGFIHEGTEYLSLQKRLGAGHDDTVATEPLLIFRKPR